MAWHRLEHARSRVSELDRQGSIKLEKSYIVETWTGSRVSMCLGSSRPPRGKPCFSSNSRASNSSSNNSRVSSGELDLLSSSSHQPPTNSDPIQSCIAPCTLSCRYVRCLSSGETPVEERGVGARLNKIDNSVLLQIKNLVLCFQGRPSPKRPLAAASNMQFIRLVVILKISCFAMPTVNDCSRLIRSFEFKPLT